MTAFRNATMSTDDRGLARGGGTRVNLSPSDCKLCSNTSYCETMGFPY